jgi:hypothetical protein
MPDTQTPNYQLWKPEIDAAADYWGQLLNANFDTIDTLLLQRLNKAAGAGQQILPNQLVLTGQPGQTVGDQSAATVGWVVAYVAGISGSDRSFVNQRICDYFNWQFPLRTVIASMNTHSGAHPAGWSPCNGLFYNGIQTPDLHDRFIIGAGPPPPATIHGDAGTYNTNPSWYLEHGHHSQRVYSGPAGNPSMQAMWQADFDGNYTPQPGINIPYYVLTFLMKTRDLVPADVG